MFRNPNGKVLRRVYDHRVPHDLSNLSSTEKGYIFLLMSMTGMPYVNGVYERNGSMQIQFPDAHVADEALRSRGYLVEPTPLDELIERAIVPELKELLHSHGLPVGGKRAELVERLMPVLTDEDIKYLREKHSFCLPSDLGYEMIYSLYDLWESRQLAVLDAIKNNDLNAVHDALAYIPDTFSFFTENLPQAVGFWDDSKIERPPFSDYQRDLIGSTAHPVTIFTRLCGFPLEFYFQQIPYSELSLSIVREQDLRDRYFENIEHYRKSGFTKVRWISCGTSPQCDALDKKFFYIDDLPSWPVCRGCSCDLSAVVELPGEDVPAISSRHPEHTPTTPIQPIRFTPPQSPTPTPSPSNPEEKEHLFLIPCLIGLAIIVIVFCILLS